MLKDKPYFLKAAFQKNKIKPKWQQMEKWEL